MEKHRMRTITRLGLGMLFAAALALVLVPTDPPWWLVRLPGMLALLLAASTLVIQPGLGGSPWHRLLGLFATVAVGLHATTVAAVEPSFWRWLTQAMPVEIIFGLVAALALLATLTVRRSLSSPRALIPHRIAAFVLVIPATAHVALIAGTSAVILALVLAGTLLLVIGTLLPERRKLMLLVLPVILAGVVTALAVGPLAEARLAGLRSSPVDHARFSHEDHTGFICTACHHNFTDRSGMENCVSCHKKLSTSETMRVDRLFHAFCGDCHRREKMAGRKTGPIDHCTACHGS
jgi:hypothetical protein